MSSTSDARVGSGFAAQRLRVAYISFDFNNHPMGRLTVGIMERHSARGARRCGAWRGRGRGRWARVCVCVVVRVAEGAGPGTSSARERGPSLVERNGRRARAPIAAAAAADRLAARAWPPPAPSASPYRTAAPSYSCTRTGLAQ